jgi:hypothetical protein
MKDQQWPTTPAGSCPRPSHRRYDSQRRALRRDPRRPVRFGPGRAALSALSGLLHPFRLRVRRSSSVISGRRNNVKTTALPMPLAITWMRVGAHGLSVEDAEVAPLGKAGYDRSLVPSEPGLGWRGSGPNRRDGPRQRPGLHPGDIRSEMISGWVSIPAPAVRSYRRRDP